MIVGISGKMGSGKNLVASIINQLTENKFEEKCFAGKLKDIVCLLIGCTREQLEDRTFKETPLGKEWNRVLFSDLNDTVGLTANTDPRWLLQRIGTEAMRERVHPNVWVNALMADYKNKYTIIEGQHHMLIEQGIKTEEECMPNWIITDVRFPNEAKAIKDKDGIIIRVNRPSGNVFQEHESETALDDYRQFDFYINNYGTIQDLVEKVRAILISKKLLSSFDDTSNNY